MKNIPSINFVPQKILKQKAFTARAGSLLRLLRYAALVLIFAVLINVTIIVYKSATSTVTVPADIQKKYSDAQKNMDSLKLKLNTIEKAEYEFYDYFDIINTLTSLKLPDIHFNKIEIVWDKITIYGFGPDPVSFNRFNRKLLEHQDVFESVQLDKIDSINSSNLKSFQISTVLK